MKSRHFQLTVEAQQDIRQAWRLVRMHDGKERANGLKNRIMTFIASLREFSDIGSRHDDFRSGLRSTGVPGLTTAAVYFVVSGDKVSTAEQFQATVAERFPAAR